MIVRVEVWGRLYKGVHGATGDGESNSMGELDWI